MKILSVITLALLVSHASAEDRWVSFVTEANQYLNEGQEFLQNEYKLGEHERFDWNQETSELVFRIKELQL